MLVRSAAAEVHGTETPMTAAIALLFLKQRELSGGNGFAGGRGRSFRRLWRTIVVDRRKARRIRNLHRWTGGGRRLDPLPEADGPRGIAD